MSRAAGRTRFRRLRDTGRATIARAAIALAALLAYGEAGAQQAGRTEIDPGQVQKRILLPSEPVQPPSELRVPAPAPVTPRAPLRFVLTGVVIENASAFDAAALAPLYEPYLAQEIDLGDIENILQAITAKYRDAGYFLSRAVVRPQPLELGILHITMIEGYVRRVIVHDTDPSEEARLSSYFAAVIASRPLRLAPLERALLLVDDIPGLHVGPSLQAEDEESGAYDLILQLQRQRLAGFASFDNRGTESLGPWQAQLSGSVNSVFSAFDRLQLSVFDTPNRPTELFSTELFYDTPLDSIGTRLGLSIARTHLRPGGSLAPQDLDATAMSYAARITYPLFRSRNQSLWLSAGFDVLDSTEQSSGEPLFDDHLRVLRGTATYVGKDDAGNVDQAELKLSQGLRFLGASHPSDAGLSRSGGRADFTKIAGSLTRQQVLDEHWGAQLAIAGQKSAEPLLLSEQFALGGVPFGRGYDPAEIAGDDALVGSIEFRYGRFVESPVLRWYQLYGFYDLGTVWNMDAGGATSQRFSLASLGAGVRMTLQHDIAVSIEIAKPLTRRVAAEGGKPLRVFVSLSASF